uniref:Uncharacterized protein n=1 Tax=Callithrix jacchus TaxID=9483 RepID=A0A8I3WR45_CALJA
MNCQGPSSLCPQVLANPGYWHLQQLRLHVVAHEVRVLAALAALQVVSGDGEGHLRGVQCALQPLLLGQQQVGLRGQRLHLALQLRLPAVRVLQPLAHPARGVLLRALRQSLGLRRQLLALVPLPLGLVAVGKGLVVARVAVLEPLLQQPQEPEGSPEPRRRTLGLTPALEMGDLSAFDSKCPEVISTGAACLEIPG